MNRTALDDLITLLIDDNNANQIDYARVKTVLVEILDSVLGSDIAAIDGAIPFVVDGEYSASSILRVVSGVLNSDKLRLKYGISEADRIHLNGLLTVADQKKALATVYYVARSNKVDVIIGPAINIADLQAGMTTKSADGDDITLTDGMQVLLKNQTDSAENGPYIVKTAEAPEVPDWYDATKNQSIEVLTGSVSKVDLPAVEEGEVPVIEVKNQFAEIELLVSGWAGNSYSLDTTGIVDITGQSNVFLSPATKSSSDAIGTSGVFCVSQDVNELIFSCTETPAETITYNIAVL